MPHATRLLLLHAGPPHMHTLTWSLRASPRAILAVLSAECQSSASAKGAPSCCNRRLYATRNRNTIPKLDTDCTINSAYLAGQRPSNRGPVGGECMQGRVATGEDVEGRPAATTRHSLPAPTHTQHHRQPHDDVIRLQCTTSGRSRQRRPVQAGDGRG